jgi:dephospho-CoA kinase
MLHVGLTGGLASGKSFVGRTLAGLGCFLILADELGHQVIEPGGEAYDAVVALFGRDILNPDAPDARIDRRRLAALVFADPEKLAQLNALVHPPVKARERALVEGFAREHPDGIAVTEAAILVETGSYKNYARLIVAVCRPEQQVERAMERDGVSREEVLDRLRRQMPLEDKVKHAHFVIDTSGSKENTVQQVRTVHEALRRLIP